MTDKQIRENLEEVFRFVFPDYKDQLTDTLQMGDLEAWDSFAHVSLMLEVETVFQVEFESSEIGELNSIGRILQALSRRLS